MYNTVTGMFVTKCTCFWLLTVMFVWANSAFCVSPCMAMLLIQNLVPVHVAFHVYSPHAFIGVIAHPHAPSRGGGTKRTNKSVLVETIYRVYLLWLIRLFLRRRRGVMIAATAAKQLGSVR
jgi:hypothetical protein